MLTTLMVLVLSRVAPPLPMVMPVGCEVRATSTELIVKSHGTEARLALAEDEVPGAPGHGGPPAITLLPEPGASERVLVALRDHWRGVAPTGVGRLYEITCGERPSARVALVAPGLDLGRVAILTDGRWVVGGWGGLRVLDPIARRLTPLTDPPPFVAPRCWSATAERPARAADVPIVDDSGIARADREVVFERLGACGYEAELTASRFALDVHRGILREVRAVPAFLRTGDGRLLVGDGAGACEGQTPGAAWLSDRGDAWSLLPIHQGAGGIARLVELPPGDGRDVTWLALTAICEGGGATKGGDLFASRDLLHWERVLAEPLPPATPKLDRGAGVVELVIHQGLAYARIDDNTEHWFRSADGRTWDRARRPPRPDDRAARDKLAGALGVGEVYGLLESTGATFAWTSDGLFRRAEAAPDWARIFPR